MNKNPFSIYDFLGYLFPGLIFGVIMAFLWHLDRGPIQDYLIFPNILMSLRKVRIMIGGSQLFL